MGQNNNKTTKDRLSLVLYDVLIKALKTDKVAIIIDYDKLNRAKSPIFKPWETVTPLIIILLISLVIMMFSGIIAGVALMVVSLLLYRFFSQPFWERKIDRRFMNFINVSYDNWLKMWNFGGFIMVRENAFKTRCIAPNGDWKNFIALNLAEELKNQTKEE